MTQPSLVTTKLRIPPPPFRGIRRERLTDTLEHEIQYFKLILVGRAEPRLPVARYRAHNELLALRAEDLQFLPEETAAARCSEPHIG